MERAVSRNDRDVDTCPYFAGSTAAATSRTCLAGDEPVTVSRRYAESYCTRQLHVACSLYVAAEAESSDADTTSQQPVPAPVTPIEPSAEPARSAMMSASTVEGTPRPASAKAAARHAMASAEEDRRTFGRTALRRWAVGALVAAVALIVALVLNLQSGDETNPGRVGNAPDGAGVLPTAFATRGITRATTTSVAPLATEPGQPTEIVRVTRTRAVTTPTPLTRAPATDTPAPAPTATPTKVPATSPTPRATETPRPPPRLTGLGLPRSRWEADHGAEENEVGGLFYYESRGYLVGFTSGRVVSITRDWGARQGVRIPTARARARALLPEDAVLVRTDTPGENLRAEVYTSRTLQRAFPPDSGDSWPGRRTGTASVVYRQTDGLVDSITVQVGELLAET